MIKEEVLIKTFLKTIRLVWIKQLSSKCIYPINSEESLLNYLCNKIRYGYKEAQPRLVF